MSSPQLFTKPSVCDGCFCEIEIPSLLHHLQSKKGWMVFCAECGKGMNKLQAKKDKIHIMEKVKRVKKLARLVHAKALKKVIKSK